MATANEKKRVSVDPDRAVLNVSFRFEEYNLPQFIEQFEDEVKSGTKPANHWFSKLLKKYKIKDMHAIERDPNYINMIMGQETAAMKYVAKILGVKVPAGYDISYDDSGVLECTFDLHSNEAAIKLLKLRSNESSFYPVDLVEGRIEAIWPHGPVWSSGKFLVKTEAYSGRTNGLEVMDVDDWVDIVAPTKRPASKRPASRRPASKRPASKRR